LFIVGLLNQKDAVIQKYGIVAKLVRALTIFNAVVVV